MWEITMKQYVKYLRHNESPQTQTEVITHTEQHQSQNIYILQMTRNEKIFYKTGIFIRIFSLKTPFFKKEVKN